MLVDIENKTLERLETAGLNVRDIDIRSGSKGNIYPAVYISTETGDFSKVTQEKYRCAVSVVIAVVFKQHKGQKDQRHGIYPILEGIVNRLMLQDMGLAIAPFQPESFRNITDEDLAEKGLIAYQLVFGTSFVVARIDDETVVDLLKIGLDYYLYPDETAVIIILSCEDAWDESVADGVVSTTDADGIFDAPAAKFEVSDSVAAGTILATDNIASLDLSGSERVTCCIESDVAIAAGDLQLLLDDTANCASPIEKLDIPALAADEPIKISLALASSADATAIISIGLKMITDVGACEIKINKIKAADNITAADVIELDP